MFLPQVEKNITNNMDKRGSKKLMPIIHTKMLNISFRNTFFFVSILILTYMCEVI